MKASDYANPWSLLNNCSRAFRPPEQLTVAEAAEKYVKVNGEEWSNDVGPYMVEPANALTSRDYSALVFVGPARSIKTQMLIDNLMTYAIVVDPSSVMLLGPTESFMSDWAKDRLYKINEYNPAVRDQLTGKKSDDVVYYKRYKTGARVKLGWPTVGALRGKEYRFMGLTEYDAPEMHQRLDGDLFQLSKKRTITFMSRGMTVVESSPNRDLMDRKWKADSPHDAPPVGGIMDLYRQGTKKLLYVPCSKCNAFFIPDYELLRYEESDSILECAESAKLECPHCKHLHEHSQKRQLNRDSVWVGAGQKVQNGKVVGQLVHTDTDSYWLRGVMACFQTWATQVSDELNARKVFEETGDETQLKTAANINRAEIYKPQTNADDLLPELFEDRSEDLPEKKVPEGARFLIMTIDCQANRFVVQVSGFGLRGEQWIVDRFAIRESNRLGEDSQPLPINPAVYEEDWEILERMAIDKRYPLAGDESLQMKPRLILCDSGGRAINAEKGETTTEKAYQFYRKLKKDGKHTTFFLVKGGTRIEAPRVKLTHPDSQRSDRKATARGEIPVYQLNSNVLKDMVVHDLERPEPGSGYVHFPSWLPNWFYRELTAEDRTDKGWKKIGKQPNEAFDLMYYAKAGYLILGCEQIDWDNPPRFAMHVGDNPYVSSVGQEHKPAKKKQSSLADLAKKLNS